MANPDDASALAAAFRKARYRVAVLGEGIDLRVGSVADALETVLPARRYAFITAWDSGSSAESHTDNDTADGALQAEFEQRDVHHLRAFAQDAQGSHREAGWLVLDLPLAELDRLARQFGQDGTLTWQRGQSVRLRMYRSKPDDPSAELWTDWVE
jgi:hypothetical protein